MHEVGFEPTNSKRRGLKPRAFDHFATHAYIYLQVPIKKSIVWFEKKLLFGTFWCYYTSLYVILSLNCFNLFIFYKFLVNKFMSDE